MRVGAANTLATGYSTQRSRQSQTPKESGHEAHGRGATRRTAPLKFIMAFDSQVPVNNTWFWQRLMQCCVQ